MGTTHPRTHRASCDNFHLGSKVEASITNKIKEFAYD
jgi:hypothetical protein